jgi:hypothetical protein
MVGGLLDPAPGASILEQAISAKSKVPANDNNKARDEER